MALDISSYSVSFDLEDDDGSKFPTIQLAHVSNPKDSTYSIKKKQCDLWEYVWGSSIMLSHVLTRLESLNNLDVSALEVGCGSGLCSLVLALKSVKRVFCTDGVADALQLVRKSCNLNGIQVRDGLLLDFSANGLSLGQLSWNKASDVPSNSVDFFLGSDILFYRGTAKPIAKLISSCLKPGGLAIISDPCRLNVEDFVDYCSGEGLECEIFRYKKEKIILEKLQAMPFVKVKVAKVVLIRKRGIADNQMMENVYKELRSNHLVAFNIA